MSSTLSNKSKVVSYITLGLATVIGLAAFLYPFFAKWFGDKVVAGKEHSTDAPLLFFLLALLVLAIIFGELATNKMNSKMVAILGVVVASGAALRMIPLPLGASIVFLLIIVGGFCFGASFGFLVGALTIFVSSFLSGGFGPWVPYQALACGWVGATAALIPKVGQSLGEEVATQTKKDYRVRKWVQVGLLCLFGVVWGYGFGALMNLWFWPYISGQGKAYLTAGISVSELIKRYFVFYFSTSFVWDSARAAGNFFLLLFLGPPLVKIFNRFKKHTSIEIVTVSQE